MMKDNWKVNTMSYVQTSKQLHSKNTHEQKQRGALQVAKADQEPSRFPPKRGGGKHSEVSRMIIKKRKRRKILYLQEIRLESCWHE